MTPSQDVGYGPATVHNPRTVALTSAAPQVGSPLRLLVAGLAVLFVLSAGPAPAASASAASAPTASATEVDRQDTAPGLALELLTLVDGAVAAVVELVAVVDEEGTTRLAQDRDVAKSRRQASKPFSMNLFRKGDFVNQKTTFWCIPASTQTMMNIMDRGRPNRSRAKQARLYRIGDRLEEDGTFSPEPEPDGFRGMGISEWAGLLNRYDYGPYELAGSRSYHKALRKAARMMRKTGKPVGLVVWRGAHAWVMSGFTATADPALTSDFRVTGVWVHDPWYPRVSSFWGRSRGPNAKVSPRVLLQDFKRYGRPGRRNPERDGRFMLVLPRPERNG